MIRKNNFTLKISCLALCLAIISLLETRAQDLSPLAEKFLESLSEDLKKSAVFPFDHSERFNWHFVPRARKGPTFHDFNSSQKDAALALLKASMGEQGYEKASAIIALETVLKEIENRPPEDNYRDPLNYHFSIFGNPASDQVWGWRMEGHHLSLNYASDRGTIISHTPSFFGSNPGIVTSGPEKGKQILKQETQLGFKLLHALDDNQLKTAKYSDKAPFDIITANDRTASLPEPRGIFYKDLKEDQKEIFMELFQVYLDNFTKEFIIEMQSRIDTQGWDQFSFAWAGSEEEAIGQPHYYRITGPDLLIEYDNVQDNANHVHTVIRDLKNDFGGDLLQSHYLNGHHHEQVELSPADD